MESVDILRFLQQYALYLLMMVIVQITLGTAAHWSTRERGWDDTWIGAIGLAVVFGAPPVVLWLAGLDARVPTAMLAQSVVIVSLVKFTEWAKRRAIVDVALFVLQTLICLLPPGLLAVWLVLAPPSLIDLLESLVFVLVSVMAVGLTAMGWDWHHHTICGHHRMKQPEWPLWQREMMEDINYALNRQATLVQDALNSNLVMDQMVTSLRQQQDNLGSAIDQVEKYRRISVQTLCDIQAGKASCYTARQKEVESQMGEEIGGNGSAPHSSLKVVGR